MPQDRAHWTPESARCRPRVRRNHPRGPWARGPAAGRCSACSPTTRGAPHDPHHRHPPESRPPGRARPRHRRRGAVRPGRRRQRGEHLPRPDRRRSRAPPVQTRSPAPPGRDVIQAGAGHDLVWGYGGNDVLCGGAWRRPRPRRRRHRHARRRHRGRRLREPRRGHALQLPDRRPDDVHADPSRVPVHQPLHCDPGVHHAVRPHRARLRPVRRHGVRGAGQLPRRRRRTGHRDHAAVRARPSTTCGAACWTR